MPEKKIVIDDLQEKESKADYQAVYLAKFHLSETNIAARLKALINAPKSIRPIDPDKALKWVQKQSGYHPGTETDRRSKAGCYG